MQRNILRTEGSCPYCRAKILFYYENEWLYGSPVRTCKKCGEKYVDERYHEIAVEGTAPGTLSIKRDGMGMLIMSGIFLIAFLIHFYEVSHNSFYSLEPCAIMVIALVGILIFVIDSIRILTGAKTKKLEKLGRESEQRLRNWGYAKELEEMGIWFKRNICSGKHFLSTYQTPYSEPRIPYSLTALSLHQYPCW